MVALRHGIPWAGLAAAPIAWAANHQLSYMIVPWVCASGINIIPLIALVFAALAAGGAFISWGSLQAPQEIVAEPHAGGHPRRMLAAVSILFALLLTLLLLIQGAAALVIDACGR